MNETPESDKAKIAFTSLFDNDDAYWVPFKVSCKLERELMEQARLLGIGSEREAKLIAERDLWRAEAQRWRKQAIDLEGQIEAEIQRLQWKQHQLERGIKELKGNY